MSDFDAFASSEPPAQEEDPAAEFLAREQDQLAQLEGDDFGAFDGEGSGGEAAAPESGAGDFDAFAVDSTPATLPDSESDPNVPAFNDAADMGYDTIPDSMPQSFDPLDGFGEDQAGQAYNDPYASVKQIDQVRQEPEKIKRWREEQAERLTLKDEESEKKKGEWREIARKELEDWYKHREEQLEKTKKSNREAEAAFCADRDESLPGHEFEKICRLCEFNPKSSRSTKDVSRMRSILLQLKQSPLEKSVS